MFCLENKTNNKQRSSSFSLSLYRSLLDALSSPPLVQPKKNLVFWIFFFFFSSPSLGSFFCYFEGSNPYAALSAAPAPAVTQREQPAPKKNLGLAKDASKIHTAPEPKPAKAADPKKGAGNNSARPGRPEREADRKGRTFPRKSGTGRGKEQPRDGKDWGEGKMGKRVEDGVAEADKEGGGPVKDEPSPHVRRDGEGRGRGGRGGGGGGRGRAREAEIAELTPEEEAALKAAKEAEERQMTLEEWQAKKAAAAPAVELKEARKVERDPSLKAPVKSVIAIDPEFEGKKQQQKKKEANAPKKEVLSLAPAPRKKREEQSPGGGNKGGKRGGGGNNHNNNNNNGPAINLEDASSFPSLGGGKK